MPDQSAARSAELERPCVPEWCEEGGPVHDDVCDNAPMHPMTKHEFVGFQRSAAQHAIEAYLLTLELGDLEGDEAVECAVDEVDEAATCYAGIGSCGRGWCNHG